MIPFTKVTLAALTFLACIRVCAAQDLPAASSEYGAFAFPSEDGRRLLANSAVRQPETLRVAICSGGRRIALEFTATQQEGNSTTGRQAPSNFKNAAGHVMAVTQSTVRPDDACFLPASSLLNGSEGLTVIDATGRPGCSPADLQRYAANRQRPVVHCWRLAGTGAGQLVALVEFARQGNNALASVVLADGARLIFQDYPAEVKSPGGDLWRVDDGGTLSPETFQVLFVLRRGGEFTLGLRWSGAEGDNLALSVSESNQFKQVLNDYWYRSPL